MFTTTSTDGVELTVHDFGGDGPPLIYAHATGFCGPVWGPVAEEVPGRHGVALDFRAHGRSTRPTSGDLDWNGMGDDVLAVVDALHEGATGSGHRSALVGVGHSMGGAALLLAEIARPGLFAGLWVFEPIVFPPALVEGIGRSNTLADGARRRRATFPSVDDAVANFASKPPMAAFDPRSLRAYVEGGFERLDDGSVTLRCLPEDEAATYEMGGRHHAFDHLGEVTCPVEVVSGADVPGPAMVAGPVTDALPHGTLVQRPDMSHFGPMEQPGEIASMIRTFLDDLAV